MRLPKWLEPVRKSALPAQAIRGIEGDMARGVCRDLAFPASPLEAPIIQRLSRSQSNAKHVYPPASRKNSRNDPAGRHLRPPRSNQRKESRLPLGKAPGNGGARRFPRRARENARIRQDLDYARRSARFSPSRLFAQEDPAGWQRRSCIAKLGVQRLVLAAIHARSCLMYRARAAPATQGRDRKRDRMRENMRPFAPRRRGLAPSTAFRGRLRLREHRLRHGEQGGVVASREVTLK